MLTITAQRLFTPTAEIELPIVQIEGRRILEVASRSERETRVTGSYLDLGDAVLAPAYIDLHIHGGASFDCMDDDPRALTAIESLLAKHGVGSYFPTTVTASVDYTLGALERLAKAIESSATDTGARARPLGIHLEGPFISHKRRGVHPEAELLKPDLKSFDKFWQAARGHIKILTIAPELDGALELISEATRRGVCVSIGHTDADFATTRRALDFGARHATHTFNAMRPLGHRDPGVLGEVLTDGKVSADIIADGIHLDPSIVKLFLAAKGAEKAVLITDAMAATGMADGHYHIGSLEVEVKDGKCTAGQGTLAGSVLTLDKAVRNVMKYADWELAPAVRLASSNPAAVVGLRNKGLLETGSDADIVVLDTKGNVRQTILGGKVN
ncbi:MAG TPA: N-acetylglucosamine-6-phosphate deacetylase [Terriglobales bacterium]|jgi:N-acetylglucosamine-6-phosphate deacetylase|nr:N-acetylglucosamine-6-phosphate deacetylase [Terriglobales bacterium]